MKRNTLSPYLLASLLLSPTTETQGNAPATAPTAPTPPAKPDAAKGKAAAGPAQHRGLSAADLVSEIEANPEEFDTGGGEDDEAGSQPKAADEKPGGKPKAEATPAKPAATPAAPAELTADQKAWLELRAAAKTPEEAAEIDKQAPAFSDEQWAAAEGVITADVAARDATAKPEELQTQLTAAQAEVTKAKTELEEKSKRLTAVEAELKRAQTQPLPLAPMHPLMTATPEELAKAEASAAQVKEWALRNWDGVAAAGDQPAYTAEQVRTAYARADKQLGTIIPAAREYHKVYEEQNAVARQVYPALFDPQSPHFQTRESILRQLPGLKAGLPQISTVMGDAIVGETLRGALLAEAPSADVAALRAALVKALPDLAKLMPALQAAPAAVPKTFKLPAKPIVPLARPGSGSTPRRPGTTGKSKGAPDVKKFLDLKAANGGNELEALTESLRDVNVD